jgi:hypothetical protein
MKTTEPFASPGIVEVVEGEVVLLGPGAITGAFTPDAAETTGKALISGAELARARAGED